MTSYTEEQIKRISELGNVWVSNDGSKQRVYFNDLQERMQKGYNLKVAYYNSGNISSATLDGEKISNATAREYLQSVPEKLWFDLNDGQFHWRGNDDNTAKRIIKTIKADASIVVVQA